MRTRSGGADHASRVGRAWRAESGEANWATTTCGRPAGPLVNLMHDGDQRDHRNRFRSRSRRIRDELRERPRDRRVVQRVPPRREGRRPLGGHRRRRHGTPLGRGHARARLLHDQGRDGHVRQQARARRRARHRRARRALLARVRRGRQGRHPRVVPVVAPGRARVGRRRHVAPAGALVGSGRRRARATGPALRTRFTARVPRDHVRMARR